VNITTLEPQTQVDTQIDKPYNPKRVPTPLRARFTFTRKVTSKADTAHDTTPAHVEQAHALSKAHHLRLRVIEAALSEVANDLKAQGYAQAAQLVRGKAYAVSEARMCSLYAYLGLPFEPTQDAQCVDVSAYLGIK